MAVRELSRRSAIWSLLLAGIVTLPFLAQSGVKMAASLVQIAETGTKGAAVQLNATDAYRLALLRMKGHLGVTRALLLQLRASGVEHHLGPPLQTIFRDTEAEPDRRRAPFTADILRKLEKAPAGGARRGLATVELAVTASNGSFAPTWALDAGSVLALAAALRREAVAEYTAAVTENEVVDLPGYQGGRRLVSEAEVLVRHASGLKGRPGHTALLDVVTLIRQAWPGIIPPPIVFDPPGVAGRLDETVAAMEELR